MVQRRAINEGDRVRYSYRLGRGEKQEFWTGTFIRLVKHESKHWKDRAAEQQAVVVFDLEKRFGEQEVPLLSLTRMD